MKTLLATSQRALLPWSPFRSFSAKVKSSCSPTIPFLSTCAVSCASPALPPHPGFTLHRAVRSDDCHWTHCQDLRVVVPGGDRGEYRGRKGAKGE
ncbi:hypothetical protein LEMLEM_LOCUS17463, partial [Lemmus lemmus]